MSTTIFSGVLVPVLTPFDSDWRPDKQAFIHHCNWLIDQGADGLAVFGTTSEANSLTIDERMELLESLIDSGVPTTKLMPGTGMCATADSIRLTRHAVDLGCAGVLILPPFYYKNVNDDGLYASFAQVIEQIGDPRLKLYLYHIPPMSQTPISLPLIERLMTSYPLTVVGLKDSGGDWDFTLAALGNFPDLAIFPGSESFLLDGLRNGAAGCITATGNVNLAAIRLVFERWKEPDAAELQSAIIRIRKIIESHAVIPALKAIVADFYHEPGWCRVRPPLCSLTDQDKAQLIADLHKLNFSMSKN